MGIPLNAKLTGTTAAKAVHERLQHAGRLKLTLAAGEVAQARPGRRRGPSMPRINILDATPTPERQAHAADGIVTTTGSRAHRVRCPLEVFWKHLAPELVDAANRYLRVRSAVDTAQRTTPAYSGMPIESSAADSHRGGVQDSKRADAAELAFIEARLEPEFAEVLEILDARERDSRGDRARTVGELARRALAYKSPESAQPAGVAMLWAGLVRLRSLQAEIRGGEETALTREEITAGRRERQAATAQDQFRREQDGRQQQGEPMRERP